MTLQEEAAHWHRTRFPDAELHYVALKLAEEAGELSSAILGDIAGDSATGRGDAISEAADVAVCLMVLLERWYGADLLDAVRTKLDILTDPESGHRAAMAVGPIRPGVGNLGPYVEIHDRM